MEMFGVGPTRKMHVKESTLDSNTHHIDWNDELNHEELPPLKTLKVVNSTNLYNLQRIEEDHPISSERRVRCEILTPHYSQTAIVRDDKEIEERTRLFSRIAESMRPIIDWQLEKNGIEEDWISKFKYFLERKTLKVVNSTNLYNLQQIEEDRPISSERRVRCEILTPHYSQTAIVREDKEIEERTRLFSTIAGSMRPIIVFCEEEDI
uniref:Uncharacterized protein n=1 Tax=Solanum tuberosum TaxID=4113 RepID=Q0KIJ1_SOLTU|nr:hypothetical protein STB1_57t00019 [Solanum tuberosum]